MKKFISIALGIVMALSMAACGNGTPVKNNSGKQTVAPTETGGSVQIPNPFDDCKSIVDAEKIAGFKMSVPEKMPEGYSQAVIQAIQNEMIQIIYKDGDNEILIRKGKGSEDISGDCNEYKENYTMAAGKLQVSIRGNDGKVHVATWTEAEYTFAITCNSMDKAVISDMVSGIQ